MKTTHHVPLRRLWANSKYDRANLVGKTIEMTYALSEDTDDRITLRCTIERVQNDFIQSNKPSQLIGLSVDSSAQMIALGFMSHIARALDSEDGWTTLVIDPFPTADKLEHGTVFSGYDDTAVSGFWDTENYGVEYVVVERGHNKYAVPIWDTVESRKAEKITVLDILS